MFWLYLVGCFLFGLFFDRIVCRIRTWAIETLVTRVKLIPSPYKEIVAPYLKALLPQNAQNGLSSHHQEEKKEEQSNCVDAFGTVIPRPNVTFQDIIGHKGAKEDLLDIVNGLKDPSKLERLGGKLRRGLVLSSVSGQGKTSLARGLANATDCTFISIGCADLLGKDEEISTNTFGNKKVDKEISGYLKQYTGLVTKVLPGFFPDKQKESKRRVNKVRKVFEEAKSRAPCIVFFDEFDLLSEDNKLVAELLTQLDGFQDRSQDRIVVIAATNKVNQIDERLMRPGRFDHVIELIHPNLEERMEIFFSKCKGMLLSSALAEEMETKEKKVINLTGFFYSMADMARGFTGADIESVCTEAARLAARKDLSHVGEKEFLASLDRKYLGYVKECRLSKEQERNIAIHESGHALVALLLEEEDIKKEQEPSNVCLKVTIIPHEKLDGAVVAKSNERRTKQMLENEICIYLAGREAEKLMLGNGFQSLGSLSDIEHVKKLLTEMGKAWLLPFISSNANMDKMYGVEWPTMQSYIEQLSQKTATLLKEHKPILLNLIDLLIENKTLERKQLKKLV